MALKPTSAAITGALVLAIPIAMPVCAWWGFGHSAVCEAALQQVAPETRRQVESLIANASKDEAYQSFGSQCVWADDIKSERPETGPWHYLNVPPDTTDIVNLERPEQGDILTAIERYVPILSDHTATAEDRLEALRFVGHFVGDLHQPMHLAYEEDWGGNKYRLTLDADIKRILREDQRDRTNMHAVWDGYLPLYAMGTADRGLVPLVSQQTVPATGTYLDWAAESLAISRSYPVRYATDDRLEALTEAYLAANADTAIERLRFAAARLAHLLDSAFSGDRD